MYRMMIVDDEKYIRLSIRNRIDWKRYDIEVVGEAGDGEEAYAGVQLYHPDMMLVDIRMPVLDGLGLIRLLSENYSHIKIIILSAYQDFEYAKKAIQLGVEDYLLKPIDEGELDCTLVRICKDLDRAESLHRFTPGKGEERKEQIPMLDISHWQQARFEEKDFCCTSFYIPGVLEEVLWKLAAGELYEAVRKLTFKTQPQLGIYVLKGSAESPYRSAFRNGMEDAVISFLWNGDGLTENHQFFFLSQLMEQAGKKYKGIKTGISEVFQNPQELNWRLAQSVQVLKYKLFHPDSVVFDKRVIGQEESGSFTESKQRLAVLYHLSITEEQENRKELSDRFINQNLGEMKKISELEYLVDEFLVVLRSIAQKRGNSYETKILFHGFRKQDYILNYENVEQLQADLRDIVKTVFLYQGERGNKDVTKIIREYIQEHFMENLTTKSISQKFHLNSTYLSTLFKEKSSITLTAYIEGVRMENARELLKNDGFSIADVAAAVGYSDANYFGKVFKKYSGVTPGQYRNGI